jgi:hypothetical protein
MSQRFIGFAIQSVDVHRHRIGDRLVEGVSPVSPK